jgi:hypothetical protein
MKGMPVWQGELESRRHAESGASLSLQHVSPLDGFGLCDPGMVQARCGDWPTTMPKVFRSSPIALRSHCATPIYLVYDARDDIALSAGSAEHPEQPTPTHHYGVESRLPWAYLTSNMPARATKETW